jgi:hypothetical protein
MSVEHAEVNVGANITALKTGLGAAKHTLHEFKNEVARDVIGTIGVAAIYEQLKETSERFDEVSKKARAYGESVESIQRVQFLSSQEDIEFDNVAKSLDKATKNAVQASSGNEKLDEAFKKVGISAKEFVNLPMEEKILALSKGLQGVEGSGERVALAIELMGRGGAQMLPLLLESTGELKEKMEKATVATEAQVEQMAILNDQLKELGVTSQTVMGKLASDAITGFRIMGKAASVTFDYIRENQKVMVGFLASPLVGLATMKLFGKQESRDKFGDALNRIIPDEVESQADAIQKAKERQGKGTATYEPDAAAQEATKADASERERQAEELRIWNLKEKLNKQNFDALSKEEKIAELRKQYISRALETPAGEEGQLQRAIDLNEMGKQLLDLIGPAQSAIQQTGAKLQSVDSIRDIGGSLAGVNYGNLLIPEQTKTNVILADHTKILQEIAEKTGITLELKEAQ